MSEFDPTRLLREGIRLAEVRYQAETMFRDRMRDGGTMNDTKTALEARTAIIQACIFEQEWLVASMQESDTRIDSVDDDLEDQMTWEIMKMQDPRQ